MKQKKLNRLMQRLLIPVSPIAFIGAALDTVAVTVGAFAFGVAILLIWFALTPAPAGGRNYGKS